MDKRWTRRALLARGAGIGLTAAAAPAFGHLRLPTGGPVGGGDVTLVVPEYPFFDGTTMRESPKLLDSLARKYQRAQAGDELVMTRFLFSYVPVTLFDRIFATADPAEKLPVGSYFWLFHLSGYFGGVWLRGELSRTGHNEALTSFSSPQTKGGFNSEVADSDAVLAAARANDKKVTAYNEKSLFDIENPDEPDMPTRGLIDTFGYNEGYLLQIVDAPPAGLSTPPGFVECPADPAAAPLTCGYSVSRLRALRTFQPVAQSLAERKSAYAELADQIAPLQAAGVERGRGVWDGLLNVQGFSQEAYEQLLDISSAFLETVQATVLASVQGAAEGKADVGRKGATANAMLKLWLASYLIGITDGRPGRTLPEFDEA